MLGDSEVEEGYAYENYLLLMKTMNSKCLSTRSLEKGSKLLKTEVSLATTEGEPDYD